MQIAPVVFSTAVAAITRELQTQSELQIAIMKQLAEGQQQISDMLQSLGIGQNIDQHA